MRPSALMVASRALAASAGSATSQATTMTFGPSALAVFSASAVSRSQMATLAPEAMNALGDGLAEALRAAGDDRYAAFQVNAVGHVSLPFCLLPTLVHKAGSETIASLGQGVAVVPHVEGPRG